MSTIWDVIAFLGPTGVPATMAAGTYAASAWFEDGLSPEAKSQLATRIKTADAKKALHLSYVASAFLDRLFGNKHFSWKCFARSSIFSIVVGTLSLGIYLFFGHGILEAALPTIFAWIFFSIIPDYLNLGKTRYLINHLKVLEANPRWWLISALVLLMVLDFAIGLMIFQVLFVGVSLVVFAEEWSGIYGLLHFWLFLSTVPAFISLKNIPEVIDMQSETSVLFYVGMLPSIWLWLYGLSVIVARAIIRISSLRTILDVDKYPVRSIGRIAALLVFIGLVLIRFVSKSGS